MTKVGEFCEAYASVTMYKVPVGHIEILVPQKKVRGSLGTTNDKGKEVENFVAMKSKNATSGEYPAQIILGTPKKIIDPQDHNFAIIYTRKGDPISPAKFLTTVLYAMATAAQADNDQYCRDFAGFNDKQSMMYRIRGIRTRESRYGFTYEDVRKGLNLLASAVYDEGIVGEVFFEFRYQRELLGSGSIRKSDFGDGVGI